jgi:hypothetical protein
MTEDVIQKTSETPVRRKPGRPAKAKPAPQIEIDASLDDGGDEAPQRAASRTQTRAAPRTNASGRLEVTGRNGEALSRTRTYVGDIFEIPQEMIPDGWAYQWNAVSIAGNSEIILDQNHMMHQNGWRPVPAERYAGTLVPKGATGNIIRGQQMLMERPMELTKEAQAEDLRNARQLISDRNESLKLTKVKDQLPEGMEMAGKYKGTGGGIRMQIDKSLDVLNVNREAGQYKLDK